MMMMMPSQTTRDTGRGRVSPRWGLLAAGLILAGALPGRSQERPPSPVRYTEAREHDVRGSIRLPGSVESQAVSLVASEVEGRVVAFPAREGVTVRKEEVLVRLNTAELVLRSQIASAQLKEARARLELAERNLDRARELFADKVVPQQDLDNAVSEFHAWQGRAEQFTAEVARIQLDLDRSIIRAPFAGTVVDERTELGEWIGVGDPVVEMVALDDLEVRVDVPERYFRNLDPDAAPTVTFEALPGLEITGSIRAIIPRADPQARTFPVKVRISNREGRIGVGMLAEVFLPAGEAYRATVVPKDALVTDGDQRFVYLINGDNTVSAAPVQVGDGLGEWIVIEGPVQAGMRVVTRGNERLMPGQSVRGEPQEYALP